MSGLEEMPPPMAAEASCGTSPRFTLDHFSFEKLLAAAWVLQCLHDQLHNPHGRDETIAELVKTQEPVETGNSGLQVAMEPVAQLSPRVTEADSATEVSNCRPADDETLAELVEAQQGVETGTLDFDAAVKVELRTAELKTAELNKSLQSEDVATVRAGKPPLPVLEELADNSERARHRSAFNLRTANLRTAFNRTLHAFTNPRPAFRVNLTLRALRTVAIATPVLLLTMVAALLLLETWRHEPFHSAQAISRPSAPTADAVVSVTSTTLTTTTRGASEYGNRDNKRTASRKPKQPRTISPPRASHRQVTDPATVSVVQGLSRYEISGLRRQAKYGDASAAFTLGMAYEVGRHVPQNCAKAARWVTTAAEAGNAAAQYNLGLRYRDGDGVPAHRAESEKWLRKAAARRYSKANLALKMLASR